MSYSGLVVVRVFGMLVVDPKFTIVNREVLPNRPTRVTLFKCELVRFALRRWIAHLNRINSGRTATLTRHSSLKTNNCSDLSPSR